MYYLYYIVILSIQQHTLYHSDQSRDYRTHRLYNVLHTVDYNLYRAILLYILLKRKTKHTCKALLSVYIIKTIPSYKLRIFERTTDHARHLTRGTIYSSPSRFTVKTFSTLYVTCAFFTVWGTLSVTVTAVDTNINAPCVKRNKYTQ